MKKIICFLACVFAMSANATLLTFDNNGVMSDNFIGGYQGIGDTYTEDGYTLTVGAGDHFDSMWSTGLYWHDGSANVNLDNYAYLTFSGGLFDLISFDFTQYSGELMTDLSAVNIYAAGTNTVNLTGLTWAAFSPSNNGIYLDNVMVTAVPEPATVFLLTLGLMMISVSRNKKILTKIKL